MGNIIKPPKGISLPNGVAEQRERERLQALIPAAEEQEQKAKEAFQVFLDTHNVVFDVHLDYRETVNGKRAIGQGMTFISRLRLPEENTTIH